MHKLDSIVNTNK